MGLLIEPSNQTVQLTFGGQVTAIRHQGKLQGDDAHRYVLSGSVGQTLEVVLIDRSGDGEARFSIRDANKDIPVKDREDSAVVTVDSNGRYVVTVKPRVNREARYDIQISLS